MNPPDATDETRLLAQRLATGQLTVDAFLAALHTVQAAAVGTADLGDAQLDLDRRRRCGYPEVVYAEGKSDDALERICRRLLDASAHVLATRTSAQQAQRLLTLFPQGRYNAVARTFRIAAPAASATTTADQAGRVVVVSAGTSDRPVAEEAFETLDWMGVAVELLQDIGVAGPQRLLANVPRLVSADAIVVVAGMEGALPSVVAGHVACPVIAVPTSVGYGANLGGIAALLSMLNSCAANVAVVNIDAGFKGGYVAGLIASRAAQARAGQERTC